VVELCELPLFTLEESGLKPSLLDGGVKTLLTVGWVVFAGGNVGNLCIPERSGGGSWKFGRLEAADRLAVKLWGVSMAMVIRDGDLQ
jgi:hypothetical protein